MINRSKLLTDLQAMLRQLEADLLERSTLPEIEAALRQDYEPAEQAKRTAQSYEEWRADAITQMASAWVLSGVFVRFLEDNGLIDPPLLAGPGARLQRARDQQELYFRQYPQHSDRDYWLHVFHQLAELSGAEEIFGTHNRIQELPNWLSGDAAGELLRFFQQVEPASGRLLHDFTDESWDTRFLGDLYQDLSEAARKKYALLQTPAFVEAFILDRTLEPALDEFQPEFEQQRFRLIDPACGSGHFLLGAFDRLLDRWLRKQPGANLRDLAQRALNSLYGVDINPYAVAIARFRLLLAAMQACGDRKLRDAPNFKLHVICGDSLLHGEGTQLVLEAVLPKNHAYKSEDITELNRVLVPGHYHAVVANPPYITPKDAAANDAYRQLYKETCYRQYSLAVPFMQRIYNLAVPRGFTGQITANSFMKREFGKRLIENFIPKIDLTHVIDTSGAYIPGHGTPTVILFGRNRSPIAGTIRAVMGIRGEPSTPADPAQGLVWSAILNQVDQAGSQSEFVSAVDAARASFCKHPWSIGGGGASELKELLDETAASKLSSSASEIGFMVITGEDNCLLAPLASSKRIPGLKVLPLGDGDVIRDWICNAELEVIWTCDSNIKRLEVSQIQPTLNYLWPYCTSLKDRKAFGIPVEEKGIPWWANREVYADKIRTPLSIAFAEVATHNHFVLDRGGKVFKQTAPVIKLPADATEEDHLALLGLLNSSVACFWMKQVSHNKGNGGIGGGIGDEHWERRYAFDGSKLKSFPVVPTDSFPLAEILQNHANSLVDFSPKAHFKKAIPSQDSITLLETKWLHTVAQIVTLQEELDWQCYRLYQLIDEDLTHSNPPPIALGQRAFEIIMARKIAAGELQAAWFERHNSTPITELPSEWSEDYQKLVQQRIQIIETNPNIALIEQPEYKRRWNTEPWDSQLDRALKDWLLNRLETYFDFDGRMNPEGQPTAQTEIALISIAQLADLARQDAEFLQVGELYRQDAAFNVQKLVSELVEAESVPLLPILRYKATGLRKRIEWEQTWSLQRQEDTIDARRQLPPSHPDYLDLLAVQTQKQQIGPIPVPPKYTSSDFQAHYWRLRGKLDVPKERWVSFPHCTAEDGTLMIAWAGYNHLQLAQALSSYFVTVKEELGGNDDPRLLPLLANLLELLPWLKQWHNDLDPIYHLAMGDYFESFIQDEARSLGKTPAQIQDWQPPAKTKRRR